MRRARQTWQGRDGANIVRAITLDNAASAVISLPLNESGIAVHEYVPPCGELAHVAKLFVGPGRRGRFRAPMPLAGYERL